ncbi:hypothetical protein FY050_13190 [Phyllobacterium endophyticum]|nr:hypothetical protein FY050_13190 [Phyllobacterium endophyticum]
MVSADDVKARIGGDLTIISVPDTGTSKDKSAGFGMQFSSSLDLGSSLSGGMPDLGDQLSNLSPSSLNPSGGRGSGTTSWITEQSGLVSKHRMDVEVEGDTLIDAGKIVSDDGDLKLKTATLTHKDFDGEKRFEGGSLDLSIDVTGKSHKPDPDNPARNDTLEGSFKLDDTRQKVRATVGPGVIEITDPQKQAKLEEAGTTPPLSELNRDPDAAMEITRDKHVDLEVYLSSESVKAAADALDVIGKSLSHIITEMTGSLKDSGNLSAEAAKKLTNIFEGIESKNLDLAQVLGCAGGKQGFNLLDLIVSSAHAQTAGCAYTGVDGRGYTLSDDEYEKCLQILANGVRLRVQGGGTEDSWLPRIADIANAIRKLDGTIGIGDHSGSETALAWSGLTHQLTRGAILKALGNDGLAAYDKYTADVASGLGTVKDELSQYLTKLGERNGFSATEIADMKYIAGAGITAVSVIVRAKGEHEHHICTNKNCISTAAGGPWTPLFKQIFKDADMNLEDAVNKVHVPGHKGPHPREYHEYVFDKLKDALSGIKPHTPEYRTALENTLNKIRQEAVTPGTQVNNWLTKGRG